MKFKNFHVHSAFLTAVSALCLTSTLPAATITWDSVNAVSKDWADGDNWVGGIAPILGDDLVLITGGSFDPTNNSGYTAISVNSITLDASSTSSLSLGSVIQVGAGGVYNNRVGSGSLFLSAELTADQIWGGTRTIFVNGSGITGIGKMTFEGSAIRFDVNSATWSAGLDVRTSVQMSGGFAHSSTITPWGTGTISLINQKTDLSTNTNPGISLASGAGNVSLATANTLANDIDLQDPGTGNFSISQNNNASQADANHHYILSGVISGDVDAARTLTFSNGRSNSEATFVLTGSNTFNAKTALGGSNTVTLALGNVDALQNSTLDTSGITVDRTVDFTVAGTNTYNLGGLTGSGDLGIGANTINVGGNDESNTYSAAISGTGGLTKAGTGTQTLTGANTYTGTTTISGGTLQLGEGGTAGSLSTSSAITNDGILSINRSDATVQGADFGGTISGTGSVENVGTGRLTLSQANTYSGGTTFSGDRLTVTAEGGLGTGAVTGNTDAELTFNTASDATFANDITLSVKDDSGIINASTTSTVTFSGNVEIDKNYAALVGTGVNNAGFVISGSLIGGPGSRMGIKDTNLTLTSTGSVVYNSFQRLTLAESGGDGAAVYLQDGATLDTRIQDSNNRVVTGGKTFIVGMQEAGTGTFSGNGGIAVDLVKKSGSVANDWEFTAVTGATAIFTGDIRSSQAVGSTITKTGDGTVIFADDNTYDGDTTISEGTLQIGNGGTTGSLNTSSTIVNNGVLAFNTTSAITQGTDFSGSAIAGTGSINNLGTGRLTLNTANTYSGGTSFTGNRLTVGAAGALGSGDVTGTSGAVLTFDTSTDATFSNNMTLDAGDGSGIVNDSTTSTVTLNGDIAINTGFATIRGTGVNNAGFVLGGTITPSDRFGLYNTNLTIASGGSIDYSSFQRLTLAELGGDGAAVYLEDGVDLDTRIQDSNNNDITGGKTFIIGMQSAGTATFSGSATSDQAVDLVRRAGSGASDWEIIAVAGATANFTGSILNSGTNQADITKTGAGTVNFSATNTYGGSTTVEAGTLAVTGTGSINDTSSVTVQSGATFQYDSTTAFTATLNLDSGSTLTGSGDLGTVAITIGSGVTLEPGNSPGELATGSQTWSDGGDYNWQVLDASGAAGTGYDTTTITGTLDLSGLTAGGFEVNVWSLISTDPDVSGDAQNFDDSSNYQWTLASTRGGITGFDADNISIVLTANNGTDGFDNAFTGAFSVSSDGNNLFLDYTAVVPEPATFALLVGLIGLGSVVSRRRRA